MGTAVSEGGTAHGVRVAGHQGEAQAWPHRHHRDDDDDDGDGVYDGGEGSDEHVELSRLQTVSAVSVSLTAQLVPAWLHWTLDSPCTAHLTFQGNFTFLTIFV